MSATAVQNLLQRGSTELAADTCAEAWDALVKSPDGTLTVNMSFKLTKIDDRIHMDPNAGFSLKTKIEGEADSEPIETPDLPNILD